MISADEIAMAGFTSDEPLITAENYLSKPRLTMSPSHTRPTYQYILETTSYKIYGFNGVGGNYAIYPVINLNKDILSTGTGTYSDPYVIQ